MFIVSKFPLLKICMEPLTVYRIVLTRLTPHRLNETSEDSYISEAQFMEIFNDLGKYILIPHYEKEPKLPLERVPQISPYIKCGEACSAKKFIYMQSRSEKLVPVLFSDWRVEEKAQFPLGRQTYIDIDDVNMMSLKYALTDKAKVSLKPEDGNSLFQILDNGLQISTGLTVLLGKRSSGKTYTLDQINAQFPGGKYIKQFSLLSTDDEQSQRKFEAALKNRGNSVTESYLGPFKTVVDDVQSVNLEQDAKEIDEYLETLKKAGEDAQRQDIFSKANLYQESNFSIPKSVCPTFLNRYRLTGQNIIPTPSPRKSAPSRCRKRCAGRP